ncbi:MAG: cell surface protein [Myxococcota bacterium]|nr:cell surface protein [Myxococcota bacterium]MDW8363905.1 cell surface protein [Myxococcales bacterium]
MSRTEGALGVRFARASLFLLAVGCASHDAPRGPRPDTAADAFVADVTGTDAQGTDALPSDAATAGSPFAVAVVRFEPGRNAGFGQDRLPDVVLGPPRGGGEAMGSLHVVSLGVGGLIELELGRDAVDGPGPDLLVFENPFFRAGSTESFAEPGAVALSADGMHWTELPCDPTPPAYTGCAGARPVFANAETNGLDPRDPDEAGGDAFDLASVGLERARFVRIRDVGPDRSFGGNAGGFDLDAVAVVHDGS